MHGPAAALIERLERLDRAARDALARDNAARAFELGLTYLGPDGRARPIPVAMPPVVEDAARTRRRAALAREVTAALAQAARAILDGALGDRLADELLAELAPVERAIVARRYARVDTLATVRVDLFVDAHGVDRVLEINATIPAMQGYSDIAARAFVESFHARFGGRNDPADVLAANGSNASDLLASLVACYRAEGGLARAPSIALLHRPGDSQLGELRYLAARFAEAGHDARTVRSDQLTLGEGGRPSADGFSPDVLYRHVFARRVAEGSPLAAILREPEGRFLFNPVDPHLEQKSMLAELSAASVEPARAARLGLDDAALGPVRAHVPWTRRLRPGPSSDAKGAPIAELLDRVRAERARLVVKRSWDFGGKGVFLGAEYGDEASLARARERFGDAPPWDELVARCADEGGWVVQERVPIVSRPLWIASAEGAVRRDVYVDVSAYTNLGVEPSPTGGVCRASGSAIVNIQSGGGVVPLLSSEAAALLLAPR